MNRLCSLRSHAAFVVLGLLVTALMTGCYNPFSPLIAPVRGFVAPPPVLKGTPLAAGGGEPGKAYMSYLKLMAGSDLNAFLGAVTAARAKEAAAHPDFKEMFPLIKAMQPTGIKVTGGAVDGTTATLLATGKDGDQTSNGKITMAKEGGAWKVQKEEWKTVSD